MMGGLSINDGFIGVEEKIVKGDEIYQIRKNTDQKMQEIFWKVAGELYQTKKHFSIVEINLTK